MKRIIAALLSIVLCLTLVFTFIACTPAASDPLVDDTEGLQYDEFGDPIFDNIRLNVWSVIGEPDNAYLNLVNQMFNDYYSANGLTAEITSINTSLFYTQLANTINTDPDNAPDVIIFHSERLTYLVDSNLLVPLDDCYQAINKTFNADNYLDNIISECYVGDSLYGVPLDVHSGIWFIREDILEHNGLEIPTTLQELEECCEALMAKKEAGELWVRAADKNSSASREWRKLSKDEDFYPIEMSGSDNIESGWFPQTAVLQNGGSLTNENGEPAWNNSEGLKTVLSAFDSWQGKYIGKNRDSNTLWSNLNKGYAIFACEGPWWAESRLNEYNSLFDANDKALTVRGLSGLFATDSSAECANYVYGVGHCFSVTKTVTSLTKRAAGALYAQYMTENAIQYMAGGHLPACKSILENPEYKASAAYQNYLQYMGDPEDFVMLGNTPYFSEVYEKLKLAYIYTLTETKSGTVEEFIQEAYRKAMQEIAAKKDL